MGRKYTEKADVYAFGIILWEILTRLEPYEDKEPMQIVVEVVNDNLRSVQQEAACRTRAMTMARREHESIGRCSSIRCTEIFVIYSFLNFFFIFPLACVCSRPTLPPPFDASPLVPLMKDWSVCCLAAIESGLSAWCGVPVPHLFLSSSFFFLFFVCVCVLLLCLFSPFLFPPFLSLSLC